jgi:uncharacterized cupredoxin-like copper-binding protein
MRFCRWFVFQSVCVCLAVSSFTLDTVAASAPSKNVASFTAREYRFEGPNQLPAGQTTVRLRNKGKDPHQLQFLKLEEGKTAADLTAALTSGDRTVPSWAKHVGGPNGVGAGKMSEATLYLEPGSYVIICSIPGKHHQSHASLGMQKALLVTDRQAPPPEFSGNFHMAMFEYEFVVVQPLRKGRHSFYVINRGTQIHQASFVRLNPGATAEDVLKALSQDNPSRLPGTLIGGISGLEPGREGTFTAELTPGRYAIMCLFSHIPVSESHAAKGMVMNFTID